MPAVLTHKALHHVTVPFAWRAVLSDLQQFVQLETTLRQREGDERDQAAKQLYQVHHRLLETSANLLEPQTLADLSRHEEVELFARATLMLLRLRECVAAELPDCIDTVELKSLELYEPDIPSCHRQLLRIREALSRFPELSSPTLPRIEAEVERDIDDAERKRKVVDALRDEFELDDIHQQRNNIFRFFESCYPETGLVADEVEMILTGTMIFFCLPFKGTDLRTQRFKTADVDERSKVQTFLRRVAKFAHWQFAHFPVFGFFRGEELSQEILGRLAKHTSMTVDAVAWELSRLIAIVPLDEADKYVVHDVWGHGWQASMLHFDRQYERLAHFADPPESLDEVASDSTVAPETRLAWIDCFPIRDGSARFDKSAFDSFIEHVIGRRLATAMTPVIAEFLADVVESKLVSPERQAGTIPNSSHLLDFPSKLDLMLQDLTFYFRQPTKTFRLWASRANRQQRTIDTLMRAGSSAQSARSAVRQAATRWRELEDERYDPTIRFKSVDEGLTVNLFTRLALNFLGLHRAMVHAWRNADRMRIDDLPLQSLRDLTLMVTAVFFEASPERNLWRMDEFLSLRVAPLCQRLLDELYEV